MEVRFENRKFQESCEDDRTRARVHGAKRAKLIRLRLDDLLDADSLQDFWAAPAKSALPGRCHEFRGHDGELLLDLDGPYRLIIRADHNPLPRKADGGLDWSRVTRVLVVRVEDPHG